MAEVDKTSWRLALERVQASISLKSPGLLAAALFVFVAVYREPVQVGNIRPWLCDMFLFGALAMFAVFLWARVSRFASLFLVMAYSSSLYPAHTQYSQTAAVLAVSGVAWYAFAMLLFERDKELIGHMICLVAIAHAVVVFNGRTLMANPNEQSALFAMCLSSFFLLKSRNQRLFFLIPLYGVFRVGSFNGIMAVGVVLFVYGIYMAPQYWFLFVGSFAVMVYFYWHEIATDSVYDRIGWWRDALQVYKKNVLQGCGIGNWKLLAGQLVAADKIQNGCFRLHNTWVQSVLEMGLPFIGLTAAYTFHALRSLKKIHIVHWLGILAFFVVSNSNSLFRMNIVNGMIAILLLVRLELEIRSARNA